jgi:hypothetical protein
MASKRCLDFRWNHETRRVEGKHLGIIEGLLREGDPVAARVAEEIERQEEERRLMALAIFAEHFAKASISVDLPPPQPKWGGSARADRSDAIPALEAISNRPKAMLVPKARAVPPGMLPVGSAPTEGGNAPKAFSIFESMRQQVLKSFVPEQ